jgi:hypothetical protein
MLPIEFIGFDSSGGLPVMVKHRFEKATDGALLHFTDDFLRATVPPEGWDQYAVDHPQAANFIASLRQPA